MAHRSSLICAAFALAVAAPSAHATKVQVSHFPPNPGVLPGGGWKFSPNTTFGDPPPQRAWRDGVYGAAPNLSSPAVIVSDVIKVAGRAGELPVGVQQAIMVADAAVSVAACVNGVVIGCVSAAVSAAQFYEQYRIRSGQSGLEGDPGQDQSQQTVVTCKFDSLSSVVAGTGSSKASACSSYVDNLNRYGYGNTNNTQDDCWRRYTYYLGSLDSSGHYRIDQSMTTVPNTAKPNAVCTQTIPRQFYGLTQELTTSSLMCPPLVDFGDPRYSTPGGPVGVDGKCPTGRYQPISAADAGAKAAANAANVAKDPLFLKAVQDVLADGKTMPGDLTTSGPATQVGTPTSSTTTDSGGTTTTTTTPTYTYHYDGDTITYDTSTTVQTCVGSNSCSTTTTTTPASPVDSQDPSDPCTKNPDRAGCSKLGTPPDPEAIQTKDIQVSITPESGFGPDNGQCPGPITLTNGTKVDPYGMFCMYLSGIRFAVIGVAWIIAALIFLGRIE